MTKSNSVPLLDLHAQYETIGAELEQAVLTTLRKCKYILGDEVSTFERQIAEYLNTSFALGVSSGTDALLLAMMAYDIGPGDIVLSTPYSFFATTGCIARLGATPMYVDVDPKTFNICPTALEAWFTKNHSLISKVKAILPVHLFGQCCDMDGVCTVAEKYNIPIIEDTAQTLGARYHGKKKTGAAGTIGAIGCYSFFPSKNLGAIGDGGLITTNDQALHEKMSLLRTHGAKPKYYHSLIGGNFRLDTIQAVALSVKLPYLDQWSKKRRQNAAYYNQNLNSPGLTKPSYNHNQNDHVFNQYVICVEQRDQLMAHLQKHDIGCEIYYPVPLHLQQCFSYLKHSPGDFPHTELLAKRSLALPIYPELTTSMQNYIIQRIDEFMSKN